LFVSLSARHILAESPSLVNSIFEIFLIRLFWSRNGFLPKNFLSDITKNALPFLEDFCYNIVQTGLTLRRASQVGVGKNAGLEERRHVKAG
jgi:hypothetical protein